jgi:S1-C subfamily serine protease
MIVTTAAIAAGDSGGPLYDANNQVIGIDTAAETGGNGTTTAAYAIPINSAMTIAQRIESKQASAEVHIGYPAFLGVGLSQDAAGTTVTQVYAGSPAASAGLTEGDTITAVDGTSTATATDLHDAIAAHSPGDSVRISWTDASGSTRTATVTLTAGPAD